MLSVLYEEGFRRQFFLFGRIFSSDAFETGMDLTTDLIWRASQY
jgi:hypothetical protein